MEDKRKLTAHQELRSTDQYTFFDKLKSLVSKECYKYFIQPTDQDDIRQDIFVSIMSSMDTKGTLEQFVKKHVGRFRQQKSRDRNRLISIPQGAT